MPHTIDTFQPVDFEILSEEVEEQALSLLANFIDRAWAKFDNEEPSIEDYYNF